ncbi:MAG TPA: CPBP family intramembrane glutamic endopeptidase [Vicinamibacterales bacterium]
MVGVFRSLTSLLGFPLGYLCAFAVYWVGWCGALPLAALGPRDLAGLFAEVQHGKPGRDGRVIALVAWPIAFPLIFAFLPRIPQATAPTLIMSAGLGIVTGVAEEVLWRGVYLRQFPDSRWWSTVYPSLAFGVWHTAPLSVLPSRYSGGAFAFVAYSTVLGLSYATAARRTRSIRWVAISHCIHDALGLGGFAYAIWFT